MQVDRFLTLEVFSVDESKNSRRIFDSRASLAPQGGSKLKSALKSSFEMKFTSKLKKSSLLPPCWASEALKSKITVQGPSLSEMNDQI